MKIVVQNFKTGELSVHNSPVPKCPIDGVLVKTNVSLISAGTDRAVKYQPVELPKRSGQCHPYRPDGTGFQAGFRSRRR